MESKYFKLEGSVYRLDADDSGKPVSEFILRDATWSPVPLETADLSWYGLPLSKEEALAVKSS